MKFRSFWILFVLAITSAVVYLLFVNSYGYYYDDWYLMYSAGAYGTDAFKDIFSVDRPGRALVMIPLYNLFGSNPFYYNLSAYLIRLVSALVFLWWLNMLFPRRQGSNLLASVFFLIYPGFLSQPNAIDYQSHIFALALAHLSIAFTIKAILVENKISQVIYHLSAIVCGLLYLSQMEWYLGFELFRWAGVFLLCSRTSGTLIQKVWLSVRKGFPALAVPIIFLVWRTFFFQSERGATDVGLQLGTFTESPFLTLFWWGVKLASDSLEVLFPAWFVPAYNLFGILRPRHIALGVTLAVLIALMLYKSMASLVEPSEEKNEFRHEMLFMGIVMLVGGLIPVILVNRQFDFANYSRYSLVSASGAGLLMAVLIMEDLVSPRIRWGMILMLCASSVLTHHANALSASAQTKAMNDFWWQVSWRVPQIEQGATLVANYPQGNIQEDYFVWGPANLLYYPARMDDRGKIRPALYAVVLNDGARNKILSNHGEEYDLRKNIITYANYQKILILTQPSSESCVQLIDGTQPELSASERSIIMLAAPFSQADQVMLDAEFHIPPSMVFGAEPAHEWCYLYQKASLARQRGEWNQVSKLGNEAFENDFSPQDHIEWMPFLQAYARDGNIDGLFEIKKKMKNADPFVFRQACQILTSMPGLTGETIETINAYYCSEGN